MELCGKNAEESQPIEGAIVSPCLLWSERVDETQEISRNLKEKNLASECGSRDHPEKVKQIQRAEAIPPCRK